MSAHPSSRRPQQLPEVGSIQEGKVVRVEAYGAFVELNNFYRVRGLVHISQLAGYKVDQVTDVVSVDDGVWVKVLEVTSETADDGRNRTKVSLSLKDASQDDGRDLGEEREQSNALTQQISRNLHSSIGMGFAQDPMAGSSQRSANRLILKHQPKQETVINGYALVDDFEGEPEIAAASEAVAPAAVAPAATLSKAPMGRGRGSTLPAWMTRADGPTKQVERIGDEERSASSSKSSDSAHRHGKKKRKHKEREKKSRHKNERRRHKHKHRKDERKHRKRGRDSQSRSRSPSPSRKSSRKSSRRHNDSDDRSGTQDSRGEMGFTSVEEAQRLIQQLEAKKKESAFQD